MCFACQDMREISSKFVWCKKTSLFDRKEEWIFTENESEMKQEDFELKDKQTCLTKWKSNFVETESLIGLLWGIYLVDKLYSD